MENSNTISSFEDLQAHFCDLRVDFLNEDELDYELQIRGIVWEEGAQMARKRGNLREALKQERQSNTTLQVMYKLDPEVDYSCCVEKYNQVLESLVDAQTAPPRCQSTLLHLGARVGRLFPLVDEIRQQNLKMVLEKVFEMLNFFFYNKRTRQRTLSSESDFLLTDLLTVPTTTSNSNPYPFPGLPQNPLSENENAVGLLDPEDEDLVQCLQRLGYMNVTNSSCDFKKDFREAMLTFEHELYLLRTFKQKTQATLTTQLTLPTTQSVNITTISSARLLNPPTTVVNVLNRPRVTTSVSIPNPQVVSSLNYASTSTTTITSSLPSVSIPFSNPHYFGGYPPLTTGYSYPTPISATSFFANPAELNRWHPNGYGTNPVGYFYPYYQPAPYNPLHIPHSMSIPVVTTTPSASAIPPISNPNPFVPTTLIPTIPPIPLVPPRLPTVPPQSSYSHKSLPVSKWKIDKYAGNDQGSNLNEFLVLVQQLSLAERISEQELFDSAFHLFTGPALNWFMSMSSKGYLRDWNHMVEELRKSFVHPELDSLVRSKIYQRRQQRNESFQDYYYDMEKLFRSMTIPMNDSEMLDVVKRNMRGDYKKYLLWKSTETLQQLVDAGRQIDASNFSLYNKMFGSEKSTNVVNEFKPRNQENKQISNPRQNLQFDSKKQKPPQSNNNYKQHKEQPKSNTKPNGSSCNKSESKPSPGRENPQEGQSNNIRSLDSLIVAHKPPQMDQCIFCRFSNHTIDQCRSSRGLFCRRCGFKGFDTQNCPYCLKNGFQTIESRRSSTSTA